MRIIRCCLVVLLSAAAAAAAERPVQVKDLPAPVQATVKAETAGATVKGISRETEHGATLYEVETIMNGLTRDILVDPAGVVVEVEEQIALEAAPIPVQQALSQMGQLLKIERVTSHGVTSFEAHIQQASKKRSVTVDANGQVVAPK
jgi:uncharacterized membrane protein YkoI